MPRFALAPASAAQSYAAPLAARLGANVNPEPAEMKVMRDPGIRELINVHGQVKTAACHTIYIMANGITTACQHAYCDCILFARYAEAEAGKEAAALGFHFFNDGDDTFAIYGGNAWSHA